MPKLVFDTSLGKIVVIDDGGVEHVLGDTADIGPGIWAIYHYPGHPDDLLVAGQPGHVTYSHDGKGVLYHNPERLYGRDGTVAGAMLVGYCPTYDRVGSAEREQDLWPAGDHTVHVYADGTMGKHPDHPRTGQAGTPATTITVR